MASFADVLSDLERPNQRPVSISPLNATEGKKAHKPGERSPCCVGQNSRVVCKKHGGHGDAFNVVRHKAPCALGRPQPLSTSLSRHHQIDIRAQREIAIALTS